MSQPNIVFFTGQNHIFLRRDVSAWTEVFAKKYGEHNISRIDKDSIGKVSIASELLTPVFLGEKRLIIIEGVPLSAPSADWEKKEWTETPPDFESVISDALDKIPETTFLLFVSTDPDKRKTLYKKLCQIATLKEYPKLEGTELREYIRKKLPHIDISALSRLIEHTGADINRIESEIDKFSLYKQDGWITEEDIRMTVMPTIETSIFSLTDAIFVLDPVASHREFSRIVEIHNIHYIFASLLSQIRTFLYAVKFMSLGYTPSETQTLFRIHPYAFEKMRKNMKYAWRISQLFHDCVLLDRRTKTGEGIGDTDDALRLWLERMFLCLRNR